jgi:hypothetical protein
MINKKIISKLIKHKLKNIKHKKINLLTNQYPNFWKEKNNNIMINILY